jgi:hypothetical protein
MKLSKMTATTAVLLGALTLTTAAVSAAAPATRAQERALERLQLAAAEHVRILTELAAKFPEQLGTHLTTAINAANEGLAKAQAMNAPASTEPSTQVAEPTDPTGAAAEPEPEADETPDADEPEGDEPEGDQPDGEDTPDGEDAPDGTTGLLHAREQVAASFERSLTHLNEVMAKVPPQAAEKIAAAIARIQANQARTLANLDRVIAGERPAKPEHAERPARLERAERPQKPERVERAERPARPEHPRP